ncbi:YneF family protein [Liquorilactobacillus oeni]|uniref:YneF family protein n=1 Tax=Liquorilactobacillus oeni TaxID=303241 RepID=UPI00070AA479|nr:YneF family protein [Liquorilactobacillus oeni]
MSTTIWVLIVILALILGFVGGFFAARKYMESYLKKNPPINESMLKVMMLQMGQKPSEKKLHQMMSAMKAQGKKK